MGLFPVLPSKITVNSSKCFSLPFSITCALPSSALLLTSLWADFMQTSIHLSCEDMTVRRGRDSKAVCHLWVHGIKLLLSYQVLLVAACKWIHAGKNSCSLLNLARKALGGGCLFSYCYCFPMHPWRQDLKPGCALSSVLSGIVTNSSNGCRTVKEDENGCLTSSASSATKSSCSVLGWYFAQSPGWPVG